MFNSHIEGDTLKKLWLITHALLSWIGVYSRNMLATLRDIDYYEEIMVDLPRSREIIVRLIIHIALLQLNRRSMFSL